MHIYHFYALLFYVSVFWATLSPTNIFELQVSWFTSLRVIVASSNITNLSVSAREIFWPHTTAAWKIHVVFVMELAGSWPRGFKASSWNKGRRRMTWPGSAVWNHSRVTCVFLHPLHLEVLEDGIDSTQRRYRPAKGHLAAPDAAFDIFLESQLREWRFLRRRRAWVWS